MIRKWKNLLAMAVMLGPSAALADVAPESGLGLPRDFSVDGYRIDTLIQEVGVMIILLFVIMCIWMAWAYLKHGSGHEAEYDHGSTRHHVVTALTISSLIFVIVDGWLFANAIVDLNDAFWNFDKAEAEENAVRIEINTHQWAFDIRYAGPDDDFNTADDIVTLNEMVIPAGAPIILQMASVDVIHAVYLPNFRQKMDAVPGTINSLWFEATDEAIGQEFDLACAEHCGSHHYKMKGILRVLSADDYTAWEQEASNLSQRAYDPEDAEAHWGWDWQEL